MHNIDAHSPETPAAENASTGPRTEAGKAVSSRNAAKHNLCSKRLAGADLEELNAIRAKLGDEWEPQTETERMLLAQMALSQWRMDRALSLELAAFDDETIDPALLALALRYRTTAERSFYKALSELQKLRTVIRQDASANKKRRTRNIKTTLPPCSITSAMPLSAHRPRPSSFRRTAPPPPRALLIAHS